MSFHVYQGSPVASTRLVAERTWALAVRAMVGHHDPGHELAQRLADTFVEKVRACSTAGLASLESIGDQRARIASLVNATVKAADGWGDDGIVFTLFVSTREGTRVFSLGPHRTFIVKVGGVDQVLLPHSLAEEISRRGGAGPEPQHALMSMRVANCDTRAEEIDATLVEIGTGGWLVTQLDDRAPQLVLSAMPRSVEDLLSALRNNAREVPNLAEDWLLARGRPEEAIE